MNSSNREYGAHMNEETKGPTGMKKNRGTHRNEKNKGPTGMKKNNSFFMGPMGEKSRESLYTGTFRIQGL